MGELEVPDVMADAAVAGEAEFRRRERLAISKVLHDDVGPALCAAGLQLGLLRSEVAVSSESSQEAFHATRAALEAAVEAIRRLSYETSPELAKRCGLKGGLERLGSHSGIELNLDGASNAYPLIQSDGALRIVRDLILAWQERGSSGRVSVDLSRNRLVIHSSPGLPLSGSEVAALTTVAKTTKIELCYVPSDSMIELTLQESEVI